MGAQPAESEARLSYAALGDLVGGVFDEATANLPDVQQHALAVALLRREPDDGMDARVVAAALLSLLRVLSSAGPLLLAVDDVHWLDRASARALEFAARRTPERVGWLLTRRSGADDRLPLGLDVLPDDRVQRLLLPGLSVAALHHLLAGRVDMAPSRPLLLRVHAASGGNPFVALELARAVASAGPRALGDPLPVPGRLRELLGTRLRSLSASAREAALVAAALSRPSPPAVEAALVDPAAARAGILEAEEAGVLVEDGSRLRFSHPLLAAALYARVSPARRRALHRRLAGVVSDPEERGRHLAQATVEPDEPTAAEIERAAQRAARRGAQDAAAELFEAAARLTPDCGSADAVRRFAGAGAALLAAADASAARSFAERALGLTPPGTVRAEVLYLLGQIAWVDSPVQTALETLERALWNQMLTKRCGREFTPGSPLTRSVRGRRGMRLLRRNLLIRSVSRVCSLMSSSAASGRTRCAAVARTASYSSADSNSSNEPAPRPRRARSR